MLDQRRSAVAGASPSWRRAPSPPSPEARLVKYLDSLTWGQSRLVELGRILGSYLAPCQSCESDAGRGAALPPGCPQASAAPRTGEAVGRAPTGDAEHGRASPAGGEPERGAAGQGHGGTRWSPDGPAVVLECPPDGPRSADRSGPDSDDGQIPGVSCATTNTYIDVRWPIRGRRPGSPRAEYASGFTEENSEENDMSPRRRRFWVWDELQPYQEKRVAQCSRISAGSAVAVRIRQGGCGETHASYAGLWRCGSGWVCPRCAGRIAASRAEDVKAAVEAWHAQGGEVMMLTLTMPHALSDDPKLMRQVVAYAHKLFRAGKATREWDKLVGFAGMIRALEVTHGLHGFHGHLHALEFLRDVEAALASVPDMQRRWKSAVRRAVEKLMPGVDPELYVPDDEHGLTLVLCHDAKYISKLGLEISFGVGKQAKHGNRAMWEIAADIAKHHDPRDIAIWRAYAAAFKGAKQLTWSRGLRQKLRLKEERTDQDIVDEELPAVPVAIIQKSTWRALGYPEPEAVERARVELLGHRPAKTVREKIRNARLARFDLLEYVEREPTFNAVMTYVCRVLGDGRGVRAPP